MVKKLALVVVAVATLFANSAYADTKSVCVAELKKTRNLAVAERLCECAKGKTKSTKMADINNALAACRAEGVK